jgi:hypothetical protein
MPSILEFSNPVPLYFNRFSLKTRYDMTKTFFSNNSMVYYKSGSLASGGVGTVKNCRRKNFKT